jgi:hypothetical protein
MLAKSARTGSTRHIAATHTPIMHKPRAIAMSASARFRRNFLPPAARRPPVAFSAASYARSPRERTDTHRSIGVRHGHWHPEVINT